MQPIATPYGSLTTRWRALPVSTRPVLPPRLSTPLPLSDAAIEVMNDFLGAQEGVPCSSEPGSPLGSPGDEADIDDISFLPIVVGAIPPKASESHKLVEENLTLTTQLHNPDWR